ncbi:hypothetical protein NVP1187O_036 [Vibrio phage 1.187.O._10N.286.49.F1]|nr:hypothetical protein NVP1187O_036 [Vibrio phage 1.187.O._10N.286.49.F1]
MTGLKREEFYHTKWDVRAWSEEQLDWFITELISRGYSWPLSQEVSEVNFLYLEDRGVICYGFDDYNFDCMNKYIQKYFEDMFPSVSSDHEAPKPIDVVEEIKQLFVAEMDKEDSEGCSEEDEDERGFEGLVYVEPERSVCIPYSVLSQDQKEFLLDNLNFKTCYGHNEPNACHFSYDEGAKVWFTETQEICDRDFLITFNQLFKYEDEL